MLRPWEERLYERIGLAMRAVGGGTPWHIYWRVFWRVAPIFGGWWELTLWIFGRSVLGTVIAFLPHAALVVAALRSRLDVRHMRREKVLLDARVAALVQTRQRARNARWN